MRKTLLFKPKKEIFIDVLRALPSRIFIANLNGFSWYSEQAKAIGPTCCRLLITPCLFASYVH
ncbi:MAG: hypothetical protein IPN56_09140 [Chitinophagaceae bacterium]|nr:hypothetical protein [Chitinophagaceae bacterium]